MNIDTMKNAIGLIGSDLIEAADETPVKTARVTAFAKPWMKWAVAAILIVVIGVGTPIALRMMGAFGGGNYVPPSGGESGNPGFVTPVDGDSDSGGPESSSVQSQEDASDLSSENPPQIYSSERDDSEIPQSSSEQLGNSSSATPDKPDELVIAGWENPFGVSGEFVKDNMPPVTYMINGKNKTFIYQKSTYTKKNDSIDLDGNEISYSIDYYINNNGDILKKSGSSKDLLQYNTEQLPPMGFNDPTVKSEEEAIEVAKSIVSTTDISLAGINNASATAKKSGANYYVTLTVAEGKAEICLNAFGDLLNLDIKKNSGIQPTPDRIDVAREKMEAKISELNNNSNGRYVLDKAHFELWGDSVYAVFSVHYYYNNSDEYNEYDYYCIV